MIAEWTIGSRISLFTGNLQHYPVKLSQKERQTIQPSAVQLVFGTSCDGKDDFSLLYYYGKYFPTYTPKVISLVTWTANSVH